MDSVVVVEPIYKSNNQGSPTASPSSPKHSSASSNPTNSSGSNSPISVASRQLFAYPPQPSSTTLLDPHHHHRLNVVLESESTDDHLNNPNNKHVVLNGLSLIIRYRQRHPTPNENFHLPRHQHGHDQYTVTDQDSDSDDNDDDDGDESSVSSYTACDSPNGGPHSPFQEHEARHRRPLESTGAHVLSRNTSMATLKNPESMNDVYDSYTRPSLLGRNFPLSTAGDIDITMAESDVFSDQDSNDHHEDGQIMFVETKCFSIPVRLHDPLGRFIQEFEQHDHASRPSSSSLNKKMIQIYRLTDCHVTPSDPRIKKLISTRDFTTNDAGLEDTVVKMLGGCVPVVPVLEDRPLIRVVDAFGDVSLQQEPSIQFLVVVGAKRSNKINNESIKGIPSTMRELEHHDSNKKKILELDGFDNIDKADDFVVKRQQMVPTKDDVAGE
jgi:hypothetical protein